MADADILAETKKGKGMHKRQIMRLLLAEMGSNELITLAVEGVDGLEYITMTKSEAIRRAMVDEMESSDTRDGGTGSSKAVLEGRLEAGREIFGVDKIGDRINR
jgi:hypothetical protein